jgi:hypothetical protein
MPAGALFTDPKKPVAQIDIGGIDHAQCSGSQAQGSQKQHYDKISQSPKIVGPDTKIADEPVEDEKGVTH